MIWTGGWGSLATDWIMACFIEPKGYNAMNSKPTIDWNELTIDWNEPVETVSGKPVVIITTKRRVQYPVLGYMGEDEDTVVGFWGLNGDYIYAGCEDLRLRNVPKQPKTLEVWVNVYEPTHGHRFEVSYPNRERCDEGADNSPDRVGRNRIILRREFDE